MKTKTFVYLRKQVSGYINRFVRDFAPPSYDVLQKLIQNFDNGQTSPDVLFFGDSVLERIADGDSDRRNLVEMVTGALAPQYRAISISRRSYHPRVFYHVLCAVEIMRCHPSVVILPVNIRVFSPQWDLRPFWQYSEEINALEEYISNPSHDVVTIKRRLKKEIPPSETVAYRATSVEYTQSPFKTVGEFLDIIDFEPLTDEEKAFRKKQIFIFHYMYQLDRMHRNLIALEDTIRLLLKLKINLLIYLTPINVDAGELIVGMEFRNQVQANIDLISELIAPYGKSGNVRYADWSFKMPAKHFFHDSFATEHLNQAGRLSLTQWIVNEILAFPNG